MPVSRGTGAFTEHGREVVSGVATRTQGNRPEDSHRSVKTSFAPHFWLRVTFIFRVHVPSCMQNCLTFRAVIERPEV